MQAGQGIILGVHRRKQEIIGRKVTVKNVGFEFRYGTLSHKNRLRRLVKGNSCSAGG